VTPRARLGALAALTTLTTAVAVVAIDQPVARAMSELEVSPLWDRVLGVVEVPVGISPWKWLLLLLLGIGCALTLFVPRLGKHAGRCLYIMFVYLAAQNATLWLKTLTGRFRPKDWVAVGDSTFGHLGVGDSFPSGHVTLVAGLLVPLAIAWPRTRLLLAVVAFVMIARVAMNAHFVSDVLGGLALVLAIAAAARPIVAAPAAAGSTAAAR
jgi:undecaprenyl-diphosphatase